MTTQKVKARMLGKNHSSVMRFWSTLLCLLPGLWMPCAPHLRAQTPDAVSTLHIQTTLTLVDGVAEQEDPKTHNPVLLTNLKKTDFRLFDNGREVTIRTLDTGINTRPIVLWLIVQCEMGFPANWASGFLRGNTQYFKPALQHLNADDLIGVAHWCDNGDAKIDLPPGTDVDAALKSVDDILATRVSLRDNRSGELAMQRMIRMVDESTRKSKPPHSHGLNIRSEMGGSRLPIFLFLYGDHSATFAPEANTIISDVLETSGMVFGLSNTRFLWGPPEEDSGGQSEGELSMKTRNLVHYYARNTGGEYYGVWSQEMFAPALDYIITQIHLRYTLGFKPSKLDGKTHELRVELTKDAEKRFPKTRLRFRSEYIPLPPTQ